MSTKTLPIKVRRQLQAVATPVLKDKGAILFRSGQFCRGAFLIRSGQVKLCLEPTSSLYPARTVGPGFVLGLPASVSGEPYSLTAQAKSKCLLGFISRRKLLNFLHRNPETGLEVLRLLSEEIFQIRKVARRGVRGTASAPAA